MYISPEKENGDKGDILGFVEKHGYVDRITHCGCIHWFLCCIRTKKNEF